jgi:hypothetical protein
VTGRYLIFVPEINADSFVFFYEKGLSGQSYSVRDYSGTPPASLRYAKEFPYDSTEILRMARRAGCHLVEAETVNTEKFDYWHRRVTALNERFLPKKQSNAAPPPVAAAFGSAAEDRPTFPMLNMHELLKLPKAAKSQDMDRMLHSPNSEDYVTWNLFQLFLSGPTWWHDWLKLAELKNKHIADALSASDSQEVIFWRTVSSPRLYEVASRGRMASSQNELWIQRAKSPDPVEGASEVDITLIGKKYLIFIEAKLSHDISPRTTYDPGRNQIVRNIDCLLERATDSTPYFWMTCRDCGPSRSYAQAVESYQSNPMLLADALPHRDPEVLADVIRRTAIFLWRELAALIDLASLDSDRREVLEELLRRI